MSSCPACGHANEDGAKFCSECGTGLAAARPAVHEERKVVTALFVDLVGFTARSEQLDPEDVRALLSPYYLRLRTELERFGGTVEKFIGDAVMALFGAPVAHEDDPERAVRAALAIRDWVRGEDGIQVRIAVNTGEALVTLGARPSEGEGMAAGDVINTAARLQSAAPVNGVLVGERTYRATSRIIDYAPAEPVTAKGKEQPVAAWEALQPRSRFGVDVPDAARSALVGRERELAVLRDALTRMRGERRPQLLTLIGVPGIGKSRLLYELSRLVDQESDIITWRQGRSLPYGEGVSFWALAEIVKAHAGILDSDPTDVVERKLGETVAAALPDPAETEWVVRHLRELVGVRQASPGGSDARDEVFAAWRRFVEALAEQRPLVLVFEDLHWADTGLLDFVDQLVDWVTDVPLLVVCSARPELLARRPDWGGGKPNAATLSLAPLSDEDTSRLISALLDRPLLRAEQQQELLLRAAGNPLFAEQYVQMLSEHEVGRELPVPETVQDLVVARLDALPPEDKRLLQDAAVIGKVFWAGALPALAGNESGDDLTHRLHELSRRQFIRRERRSSLAGEEQYAFLHVLLRDIAYGQLPRSVRADKHAATAAWIEALGRPDDFAELLAHHYLAALELLRTTGRDLSPLAAPARAALRSAGDRALALSAFDAAAGYYEVALGLWPETADEERAQLTFRLAAAHMGAETDSDTTELETARDVLLAAGITPEAAEAEARLAKIWWFRGRRDRSSEHLQRAEALSRDQPATPHKAYVLNEVARCRMLAGDTDLTTATEALRIAEELGLDEVRANLQITIGTVEARLGRPEGEQVIRQGLDLALASNYLIAAIRGYSNLATILDSITGDQREMARLSREGLETSIRMGVRGQIRWSQGNYVQALLEVGDWDTALRMSDEFVAESATSGSHYLDGNVLALRGWLRLARGDAAGAVADQAEAVAKGRLSKDPQTLLPALALSASILALTGDLGTAGRRLDELLAAQASFVEELGQSVIDVLHAATVLGRADDVAARVRDEQRPWGSVTRALVSGDTDAALRMLDDMHAERSAALTRLRAAQAAADPGVRAEHLHKALDFFHRERATRFIREAEALLPASA